MHDDDDDDDDDDDVDDDGDDDGDGDDAMQVSSSRCSGVLAQCRHLNGQVAPDRHFTITEQTMMVKIVLISVMKTMMLKL